ncbi:alpha/beta hydrolase [Methylocella sp. CPCC 101449]|uniref:alpha/beta fold hydrolase n=1 Tax=Methylocella sp. CPCC 101449 TaxID=2987531 RepID=UPI00288F1E9F|nr:alpha/beta hydrolase [Methylocella sp. CPCC 101449]MDT2021290.1 alpha/beta hydrolase [Methylocella sp. CPCC 101449]
MKPTTRSITVNGAQVSMLQAGPTGATPALLLHGGRAGQSPIAYGSHLWGKALSLLGTDRSVVALDLPGAGGSDLASPNQLTIDGLREHLDQVIVALGFEKVHLVGHDIGGLAGLWLALSSPRKIASLSIVASAMAPPMGDGLDDIVYQSVPTPLWSRESQFWAFDRLSHSHAHIDDGLLDACVAAATGASHRAAVAALREEAMGMRNFGIPAVKGKMWAILRDKGIGVPTQLVWSDNDPLAARDGGNMLFRILAEKQYATYFHIINRAGSFAFREQPEIFAEIVGSFHDSVDAMTPARSAA